MHAARGGEAVNHAIDLAEVLFHSLDDCFFHLIGKRVAVERTGVEARRSGFGLEGGGIIPPCRGGATFLRGLLEKHTDRRRAAPERCGDAARQAVARRGADHENLLGRVGNWSAIFYDGDLSGDMLGAADGVGGCANESTDFGCDDHGARLMAGHAALKAFF